MSKMVKYIKGKTHEVAVVERKCVTVSLKMLLTTACVLLLAESNRKTQFLTDIRH
jgi:hypothetical protein